jgi:hypothetical protein
MIQILIGGKAVTTKGKAFSQQILLQQTCQLNQNSLVSLLMSMFVFRDIVPCSLVDITSISETLMMMVTISSSGT